MKETKAEKILDTLFNVGMTFIALPLFALLMLSDENVLRYWWLLVLVESIGVLLCVITFWKRIFAK